MAKLFSDLGILVFHFDLAFSSAMSLLTYEPSEFKVDTIETCEHWEESKQHCCCCLSEQTVAIFKQLGIFSISNSFIYNLQVNR